MTWENGDKLTLNDVYTAPGINEIIISAVNLIKRQGLICNINKNGTYLYSERQWGENGNGYELEHDGEIIRFKKCAVDYDTATENNGERTNGDITGFKNTYVNSNYDSNRISTRNLLNVRISNKIVTANETNNSQRVNTEAEKKNAIT